MADVNILIAFYSRNGSTEQIANAVAQGAEAAGAEVRLCRARDIVAEEIIQKVPGWAENRDRMQKQYKDPTPEDAVWADGILFGTPTRFGNVCAELKAYIDSVGGPWAQGKFNGKAGGAFSSTSSRHGGNESTILSLYNVMSHLGLIITPLGYTDPSLFKAGTPYGATMVSGQHSDIPPTADDIAVALYQGRRTTEVARALRQGGISRQA